jgi:ADP-ribosylglycohydrolase
MRTPFPYFGSKSRIAPEIWQRFGDPGYYFEPFGGALIQEVAQGSFRQKQPPAIKGSGWVVKSLEAALWAFHDADNFEEAVLRAVNLGDDADTTGASAGSWPGRIGASLAYPNRSGQVWHGWICWRRRWRGLSANKQTEPFEDAPCL